MIQTRHPIVKNSRSIFWSWLFQKCPIYNLSIECQGENIQAT